MVQLSSPLLCCLPLAQNLSGISLEFMIAKKKDQQILSPLVCSSSLHLENKKKTPDIKRKTCDPGLAPSSQCDIQPGHELFTQSQWPGNIWELSAGIRSPSRDRAHPSSGFVLVLFTVCGRTARPGQLLAGCISCFSITQPFPNNCWSNHCHCGCRDGDFWSQATTATLSPHLCISPGLCSESPLGLCSAAGALGIFLLGVSVGFTRSGGFAALQEQLQMCQVLFTLPCLPAPAHGHLVMVLLVLLPRRFWLQIPSPSSSERS